MTLGGIILAGLVVTAIAVCSKVREHSRRIKELEEQTKKPGEKK